jgi:hypothetical protein
MLMRRALAILLAALFSFELIAPALLADAASDVPACCRRNGKHHCAMADGSGEAPTGPSLKSLESRCPFFPKPAAITGYSKTIALGVTLSTGAPNLMGSTATAPDDTRSRTALRDSVRKRGPPPSLN